MISMTMKNNTEIVHNFLYMSKSTFINKILVTQIMHINLHIIFMNIWMFFF